MVKGFCVRMTADIGCFTQPMFKTQKVSYPMITHSAARGFIKSIFWKPEMEYVITKITVMKPIKYITMGFNDCATKLDSIGATQLKKAEKGERVVKPIVVGKVKRTTVKALKDIEYIIEGYVVVRPEARAERSDNTPRKYLDQLKRRVERGEPFKNLCAGMSDFGAEVSWYDKDILGTPKGCYEGELDLGMILSDIQYDDEKEVVTPEFDKLILRDSVYHVKGRGADAWKV